MLIELLGDGLPEGLRGRATRRFAVRLGRYRDQVGRVRVVLAREGGALLGWSCRVEASLVGGGAIELEEKDLDGLAACWRAAELLARRLEIRWPSADRERGASEVA